MELSTAGPIVLNTLTNACNQNADILKPAEKQLQTWETEPGFYTILSEIFCDHSVDLNVRWLAVLYCKNGVDRYWRKTAPNAIGEEEKERLKSKLISDFREPVPQIATQLAVLISKIARLDCPRNWSELLPTLHQNVRCPDQLSQERALLILHHVTKTLASKRLATDRKVFEDVTKDIFELVFALWSQHLKHFHELAEAHNEDMGHALDRAILTCRILRKQIAFGTRNPNLNPHMINFLHKLLPHLKGMLDCRQSMWGNHQIIEKCEKMIILITKVLVDILEMHPLTFIQLVRPTLEFVVTYNFSHSEKGLLFERFTVNCFNLMKGILTCDMYRPVKDSSDALSPANQMRMEAYKIKMEFFNFATLSEICHRLVSQYFLLSMDDLTTWDTDPEEFCQEEGGDSYKYSLRPCTEVLFLSMFKEFRTSLTPILLELVQSMQGSCDPQDMVAILHKDAVYNAVGLTAFDLFDEINFDEWFTSLLLKELDIKHVNYRIIRRRVIWLCGHWVGVKMSPRLRPALYQAIQPLLNKEEDLVVRLEAAMTLKTAVDDFEFSIEQFLPFLDASFTLLFELLKEVRECDTKMQVLHVISFVIERVGSQIRPYTSSLLQYLPALWQDSSEHNMLRCAILTTLIHLVQGFGSTCTSMYDFLLPVIHVSTDVSHDQHVYLMEDGLELWHETLKNAPTANEHLLQLYRNMSGLLELGTENIRICLKVIEAYLLLCPQEFMQHYSRGLVDSLRSLTTDIRPEGLVLIYRVIELVFKVFPSEGPQVFQAILPAVFKAILQEEEHSVVMAVYLTLFSWIILQNQDFLWKFLSQVSPDYDKDINTLLGGLIEVYIDKIDIFAQPEKRKLVALSLASLLSINTSAIEDNFHGIVNLCVGVLHDVTRIPIDEDPSVQLDSLVLTDQDPHDEEDVEETEHDKRKRILCKRDPVHNVPLKDYLMSQLNIMQQLKGQAHFEHLMDQVDSEVVRQLHSFT